MVIYEVNLTVQSEIAREYSAWLPKHIQEVVQVGGFLSAEWFEREGTMESVPSESVTLWTIHYRAMTREQLQLYLSNHAPRLREEAVRKFGDRFTATRRVLLKKK